MHRLIYVLALVVAVWAVWPTLVFLTRYPEQYGFRLLFGASLAAATWFSAGRIERREQGSWGSLVGFWWLLFVIASDYEWERGNLGAQLKVTTIILTFLTVAIAAWYWLKKKFGWRAGSR